MKSSVMGSTLRRLKIYYINNVRVSRLAALVVCLTALYLLGKLLRGGEDTRYGIVRQKVGEMEETGFLTDDEIKARLDALQDTRPVRCRDQAYDFTRLDVPETVSIVMDFHGRQFYDLQLTLASVAEHTPFDLYTEIVVIDDGTTDMAVRRQAAQFLQNSRYSKVKLYRSETQDGQASSRFKAAQLAKGSILIYVSATSVVNHGWVQPLIAHVAQDDNLIAVPHADNLLSEHRFFRTDDRLTPLFSWSLYTTYLEAPPSPPSPDDPELHAAPVMRGDVFAVKKAFLDAIGNFDEHFKGQEPGSGHHLELSLRAWMCDGSVKLVACSRVATRNALRPHHVSEAPNYRRIVELWFGERRAWAYQQGGVSATLGEAEGRSLTMRRGQLRQLGERDGGVACKDFGWYLANVAKDVIVPSRSAVNFGKLKAKTNYCLRAVGPPHTATLDLELCRQHIYDPLMMFELTGAGWLVLARAKDRCVEPGDTESDAVELKPCVAGEDLQAWRVERGGRVVNSALPGMCLTQVSERDEDNELVHYAVQSRCAAEDDTEAHRKQTWEFVHY